MSAYDGPVVLELPMPCTAHAKRALLRGACRRIATLLRDELGYPGAALALEAHAEKLRTPHAVEDDGEATVVDLFPLAIGTGSHGADGSDR